MSYSRRPYKPYRSHGNDENPSPLEIAALLVIILLNVWVLRTNYSAWAQRLTLVAGIVIAFLEVLSYLEIPVLGKGYSRRTLVWIFTGLAFALLVFLSIGALARYVTPVDIADRVEFADGTGRASVKTDESFVIRAAGLDEVPRVLTITLLAVNQNDALGECAEYTELTIASNGFRLQKSDIDNGIRYEVSRRLGDGQSDAQFDLTVRNVEEEKNCVVDISIEKAELHR